MESPFFLNIINFVVFGMIVVLLLIKAPFLSKTLRSTGPFIVIGLFLVIFIGGYLRFISIPHKFQTFYEEYEIYNSARMISDHNDFSICADGTLEQCIVTKPPVYPTGFPFLSALYMKITGEKSPDAIFTLNAILGTSVLFIIFFAAFFLFNDSKTALIATVLAASHPLATILSTSGGMETSGLFFVAILLLFLSIYFKNSDSISALGVLFSSIASFLITPEYAFLSVICGIALFLNKNAGSTRFPLGVLTLISPLMIKCLPEVYQSVFTLSSSHAMSIFKNNVFAFTTSQYYILLFTALGAIGFISSLRKIRPHILIGVILFTHIIMMSLYGKSFSNGDFIRYSLPSAILFSLYAGVAVTWLLSHIKSLFMKNISLCIAAAYILSSSFQLSQLSLTDYMMEQDIFLKNNLPKISANCAVFSLNPSLVMSYSNAKAYELTRIEDFRKTEECLIFIREVFCAGPNKEECDAITSEYEKEDIATANIFGYYVASITRLLPKSAEPAQQPVISPVDDE